jgi:DNA-directed RNA polymerase beta subunit/DNA-directed RNA polymerase beta' subunit
MADTPFTYSAQYESMRDRTLDEISSVFPIKSRGGRELRLKKIWVEDKAVPSLADEKAAILNGGTLGSTVKGDLQLVDENGKVVDSRRMKLAEMPRASSRTGAFIIKGNQYQVSNQLRLRHGVFVQEKKDGGLKAFVNLGGGAGGRKYEMFMGDDGVFKLAIDQGKVELYPLLKSIGVSDAQMQKAWGDEILEVNKKKTVKKMETVPKRAAKTLTKKTFESSESAGDALKGFFDATVLDPDVNKLTLGEAHSKFDGSAMLSSARELLRTHRGERPAEDRDSLVFKGAHSVEDFLPEAIKKSARNIEKKIQVRLDLKNSSKVGDVITTTTFAKPLAAFFTTTELSSTPDQTNPLDMLSGQNLITVRGEGGIKSAHAITAETRSIHPTHLAFLDPVHTPESDGVGSTLHLPIGVKKDGNKLKTPVLRMKDKQKTTIDNRDFFDATVAFSDQWDHKKGKFKSGRVLASQRGELVEVSPSKVDYVLPSPKALFGWASNLTPFMDADNGNRVLMAAGMSTQAVPLKDREAPRVQVRSGGAKTFEEIIGEQFSHRSPVSGTIAQVHKDKVIIEGTDGKKHEVELFDNHPLNTKSFLHAEPLVKAGDKVSKGTVLADTNFTRGGTLAMGTNLRTAFMPYEGLNFEDGIVITETAAKRLTSEHMHKKKLRPDDKTLISKQRFRAEFPDMLSNENSDKLDDDGIVRVGQKVAPGDVMVAAMREKGMDPENMAWGRLSRLLVRPYSHREAVTWDKDVPGVVTDVSRARDGSVQVFVKTEEPAQVGDKLAGRHGNKGIIVKIIPDNEAPHDADGKPVEAILNPHGVPSRINIGQMYETAVGKTATSEKPFIANNFHESDDLKMVRKHLKDAGLNESGAEELYDPRNGERMRYTSPTGETRDPLVGQHYMLKLFKQAGSNFSARYRGSYDVNDRPVKGSGEDGGAKSMDMLTFYAMLGHNARKNLQEMATYKAERNDDFWRAIESGRLPPPPRPTFAYQRFIEMIRATGVEVEKNGSELELRPQTDAEIRKQSNGLITKPQFMRAKDLQALENGLMSKKLTGGPGGTKWTHFNLKEPIPSPLFEDAIKKTLGITKKDFDGLVAGTHGFTDGNKVVRGEGDMGTAGLKKRLAAVDVEKEILELEQKIPNAKRAQLDNLNKRLKYLKTLKKHNLKADEAYMMETVPILPPMYRPIYPLPDGSLQVSPSNWLYRDIGVVNEKLGDDTMELLDDDDPEKQNLRKDLYKSVAALQGLGDPVKFYKKNPEGFLAEIKGKKNKEGFFQSKVLSRTQDLTARGTIIPEPSLGVDQVGLPDKMSWTLFEPFVKRELVQLGRTPLEAKKEIDDRSPSATAALDAVMSERLVMLNRAPSLHKFAIMAFQPQRVKGKAIRIPPLVVQGFNADFDGDAMVVHMPVMPGALQEARGMVPSKHLFNPRDSGLMLTPGQEGVTGLFLLSETQEGRDRINEILPDNLDITKRLEKKEVSKLLNTLATEHGADYGKIIDRLKRLGDSHATAVGFTVNLDDLDSTFDTKEGAPILAAANMAAGRAKGSEAKAAVYREADKKLVAVLEKKWEGKPNGFFDMLRSGGKGNISNSKQILGVPGIFQDPRGFDIPIPVTKSFSHGLPISQYWTSLYGARKGSIDRSLQTSIPGAFNKDIMATAVTQVITEDDCGTTEGRMLSVDDSDTVDRYVAKDAGPFKAGTLITPTVLSSMKKAGVRSVDVRSPMRCSLPKGVCAKCFGLRENGKRPEIGDNVGAIAGQSMSEPLTQMMMNTKHTGGAAGTGLSIGGYETIDKLLKMPKELSGKATLSDNDGTVERIVKAPTGGFDVWIRGKAHRVPASNPLKVKAGDQVQRGDPLSEGVIRPQDILERKGMRETQDYLANSLGAAYSGQGRPVKARLIETVVRGITNSTRVIDPGSSDIGSGDTVPWSMVEQHNLAGSIEMPLERAIGKRLARDYGRVLEGTEVDAAAIKKLKLQGVESVRVKESPILHRPVLKGIKQIPSTRQDWMAQLGYSEIIKGIKEGATQGWKSDIHDLSPVPAFAYGAEFGNGKRGAY